MELECVSSNGVYEAKGKISESVTTMIRVFAKIILMLKCQRF